MAHDGWKIVAWEDAEKTGMSRMREWFLDVCAGLFFVVGVFAVLNTRSDIQVIVAVLAFGFSALCVGLVGVGRALGALGRTINNQHAQAGSTNTERSPLPDANDTRPARINLPFG